MLVFLKVVTERKEFLQVTKETSQQKKGDSNYVLGKICKTGQKKGSICITHGVWCAQNKLSTQSASKKTLFCMEKMGFIEIQYCLKKCLPPSKKNFLSEDSLKLKKNKPTTKWWVFLLVIYMRGRNRSKILCEGKGFSRQLPVLLCLGEQDVSV